MRFDVITIFPEMVEGACSWGVLGRALKRGIVRLKTWDPRAFAEDPHRTVDDRPYGGGPGMVMKYRPLKAAILAAKGEAPEGAPLIYLSPQGERLEQRKVRELAKLPGMILLAGRYEGIDERLIEGGLVDEELSIGDYVLSGGELAALVVIDAVARLLPGVLHREASADQDSYMEGLLDCPHYTRPEEVDGMRVPEVLLSGHHAEIARWRKKQALGRTWLRRPDLLRRRVLSEEEQELLLEFQREWRRDRPLAEGTGLGEDGLLGHPLVEDLDTADLGWPRERARHRG